MTIKAGFISSAPDWHWIRQFPNNTPHWNGVEFSFGEDVESCDIVFVYDAIPDRFTKRVSAQRSMFVASEPPSVKVYDEQFLSQFNFVLTPDIQTPHHNKRSGPLGLPWLVGAYDIDGKQSSTPMTYDDFKGFQPSKSKLISVVSSNKAFTSGHQRRLDFVDKLKSHFGEKIDVFGRNINGFSDKLEVLSEYKYHIAIENSAYADYWTEKLSDTFLTLTYPIYYGSPNVGNYFDARSMTCIDIEDPANSISVIEKIIDADTFESSRLDLEKARDKILNQYNIFSILSERVHEICKTGPSEHTILPEKSYIRKKKKKGSLLKLARKIFG